MKRDPLARLRPVATCDSAECARLGAIVARAKVIARSKIFFRAEHAIERAWPLYVEEARRDLERG